MACAIVGASMNLAGCSNNQSQPRPTHITYRDVSPPEFNVTEYERAGRKYIVFTIPGHSISVIEVSNP